MLGPQQCHCTSRTMVRKLDEQRSLSGAEDRTEGLLPGAARQSQTHPRVSSNVHIPVFVDSVSYSVN